METSKLVESVREMMKEGWDPLGELGLVTCELCQGMVIYDGISPTIAEYDIIEAREDLLDEKLKAGWHFTRGWYEVQYGDNKTKYYAMVKPE